MNMYRWLLLPPLVLVAFIAAFIFGGFVSHALGMWDLPAIGFCTALAVVLTGHHTAPTYRFTASVILLLTGGTTAYLLIGESWYPDGYDKAYEPTYLPLLATFLGGLLGVAYSFLRMRMIKKNFV